MAERHPGRHRVGQHLPRGELHVAVRRLQGSGIGRENGTEAIDEYLQTKSVWINTGAGGGNPFVMKTAS